MLRLHCRQKLRRPQGHGPVAQREGHLDAVLEQAHRNSGIADRKFVALQRSYRCLLAAVAP